PVLAFEAVVAADLDVEPRVVAGERAVLAPLGLVELGLLQAQLVEAQTLAVDRAGHVAALELARPAKQRADVGEQGELVGEDLIAQEQVGLELARVGTTDRRSLERQPVATDAVHAGELILDRAIELDLAIAPA